VDTVLSLFASPPAGITLRRELPDTLPAVLADRDQVTQVLLNLVQNAEQALPPGGGTITVRAAAEPGAVVIEVSDSGRGIRPEDRERIFEPYFTTREGGTGLGLAIARRIAEEHGGTLTAADPAGPGARLRLTLPARRSCGVPTQEELRAGGACPGNARLAK
jgi:two-component system nitrogen regulation sensor histidine kinase NtrY